MDDGSRSRKETMTITLIVLFFYSVAILQFTLITTASTASSSDDSNDNCHQELEVVITNSTEDANVVVTDYRALPRRDHGTGGKGFQCVWHEEFFQILVTLLMQDGPFFLLRLALCVNYAVVNELHIFFLLKNALVISLLLYRLCILSCHCKGK